MPLRSPSGLKLFPLSLVESVVADGPQLSDFSGSLALG